MNRPLGPSYSIAVIVSVVPLATGVHMPACALDAPNSAAPHSAAMIASGIRVVMAPMLRTPRLLSIRDTPSPDRRALPSRARHLRDPLGQGSRASASASSAREATPSLR